MNYRSIGTILESFFFSAQSFLRKKGIVKIGMAVRPLRQEWKQGRHRTVSGNGRRSPPPLFPFLPLARRTIPQATSGAGGISVSQGLGVAVTCICEDADASILLHPPRQILPKIHLFHPTNARLRLSSFFTILQLLYRNLQVLYRKMKLLYV